MRSSFIQPAKWTVLFLFIVFLSDYSYAVSKEEWQQLNLFYGEKDLVTTSTRHPKHISQIPENMEIITSEEIEKMNVHTLGEILKNVTGLFVNMRENDFGTGPWPRIQGSGTRVHVKLLVDGIGFNTPIEGYPSTMKIPVGIIERIEIIKGPASSTWGSSLGGVINIITKNPEKNKDFSGKVSSSYGKSNSQDHRLEFSGTKGPLGYYIFGNIQDSDGLVEPREFKNQSYFSKFVISPVEKVDLTLISGYSEPEIEYLNGDDNNILVKQKLPACWFSGKLSAKITNDLLIDLSSNFVRIIDENYNENLSTGVESFQYSSDDDMFTISAKLSYEYAGHALVFGYDKTDPEEYDYDDGGTIYHQELIKEAFFINNTFNFGNFTIVPGIRYDSYDYQNYKNRYHTSPSFGAVYRLNDDSVIRGTIAKGFNEAPLGQVELNPDLKSEDVTSFQAGFETRSIPYIWLKTSFYFHNLENRIKSGSSPTNIGDVTRFGGEFEVRTLKIKNFMFSVGTSFVKSEADYIPGEEAEEAEVTSEMYAINTGIVYEDRETPLKDSELFRVSLNGRYIYWDMEDSSKEHDDFIFDLTVTKKINLNGYGTEFYIKGYNIFNGKQYTEYDTWENPSSWIECGVKIYF